jgi:hypothetical protein
VVVNERRAGREVEREGAAEKRVRVGAGRRRREAKSLEAMVAGLRESRGVDGRNRYWRRGGSLEVGVRGSSSLCSCHMFACGFLRVSVYATLLP